MKYLSANTYLHIVDKNLDETIRADVLALLVATITDVWHQELTLVSTTDAVVNTLWLSPAWLRQNRSVNYLMFLHKALCNPGKKLNLGYAVCLSSSSILVAI